MGRRRATSTRLPRNRRSPESAWAWIAAAAVGVLVFIVLLATDVLSSDGKEALSAIVTAAGVGGRDVAALRAAERSRSRLAAGVDVRGGVHRALAARQRHRASSSAR